MAKVSYRLAATLALTLSMWAVAVSTARAADVVLAPDVVVLMPSERSVAEGEGQPPLVGQLLLSASPLPAGRERGAPQRLCSPAEVPTRPPADHDHPQLQELCDIAHGASGIEVDYDATYLGLADDRHHWSVTATLRGASSLDGVKRFLSALIDGRRHQLSVTYRTAAQPAAALTIVQPPERWRVRSSVDAIGIRVQSAGAAGGPIRVASSSLQDPQTNLRLDAGSFDVCGDPQCNGAARARDGEIASLYLRARDVPPGEYTGELTLAVSASTLSNPIDLTVLATSSVRQLLGVLLIGAGVALSLLITVVAPHRARRLEMLRPAIMLRSSAADWLRRLTECQERTSVPFPLLEGRLREIQHQLSDAQLIAAGYVPGAWPNPIATTASPPVTYATFLGQQSSGLSVAAEIIGAGIEPIAASWELRYPDARAAAEGTLAKLDDLGRTATQAEVRAKVAALLAELDAAMSGAARGRPSARTSVPGGQTTIETLTSELGSLSTGVWFAWMLITIIAGYAALIATDPGFGTANDLLTCFGWGLGLQIVGPQLTQLTTGKVAQQLSINVMRQ